jgi:bacteriorhodopsin
MSEAQYPTWMLTTDLVPPMPIIGNKYTMGLVVVGDLTPRWICWALSMSFFLYIVYELLVGLSAATAAEADPVVKSKIKKAQVMTVISWCTYPIVYLFPMIGMGGTRSVVNIQVGYCASDIISKCGVGLLIYNVSVAKTKAIAEGSLLA